MTRTLIVNADDYGLARGINDSILEAADRGTLGGVSVLGNGEDVDYALREYAKRAPRVRLAVHLALTEGKALSAPNDIPLIADERGMFRFSVVGLWMKYLFSSAARRTQLRAEVGRELAAQLARMRGGLTAHGLTADAVDGHQHVHMLPFVFDEVMQLGVKRVRIPSEPLYFVKGNIGTYLGAHSLGRIVLLALAMHARVKARACGVSFNDHTLGVLFSGRMALSVVEAGLRGISSLPPGETEVILHPASAREGELAVWKESRADIGWHYSPRRHRERELVTSSQLRALLASFIAGTGPRQTFLFRIPSPVRFLVSGSTAFGITIALLSAFTEWGKLWYILSATLAFSCSIAAGFLLHKYWTFSDRASGNARRQFASFITLNLFNVGLNALGLYLVVEHLHIWYIAAEVLVALAIALWSFTVMRLVIFRAAPVR